MWSYMPPDAIASSDVVTISRARVVAGCAGTTARTRSRLIVDGNFGAAPKPPHSASKLRGQRLDGARRCGPRPAAVGAGCSRAVREIASRRAAVFLSSSSRRLRPGVGDRRHQLQEVGGFGK